MAVKIRLKRMGKIRNAQYRIVVMDSCPSATAVRSRDRHYQPKNERRWSR